MIPSDELEVIENKEISLDPIQVDMNFEDEQLLEHPVTDASAMEKPEEKQNKEPPQENSDAKLQELIDKMESALGQGTAPNFKLFWELRKTCLESFKENIAPASRAQFWARYRELSKEAKKLKDLFDEQSAFAVEQIEIAIKALENDIEEMPQHLEKMAEVDFGDIPKSFQKKIDEYAAKQKKLTLLNAHASRVNTLRKELIKTEMRIKHKNNFFERLSKAGDRVFPERKELIREVSEQFEKDVEAFVAQFFGEQKEFVPTYFLRDDIKHLQNIAKILTLNSHAFSASRKKLSECWDALKQMDKERKKEIQVKRDSSKKYFEEALAKVETAALSFNESQISPEECLEAADSIFKELRTLALGKEESKQIKDKLTLLKKNAQDKIKEKQDERTRAEREKRYKKQEALQELQNQIQNALQSELTGAELKTVSLKVQEDAADFLKEQGREAQDLAKKLKALNELIIDKEDEEILHSSGSGAESLKALREMLQQKKKRRSEIKDEMEKLRKAASNSGFDIENALRLNEQVSIEKERLEKIDLSISEIEDKIAETKAKLRSNP